MIVRDLDDAVREARALFDAGDAAGAAAVLEPLRQEGWNKPAWVKLFGASCCTSGNMAEGIAALRRACDLEPTARCFCNLARALRLDNCEAAAREAFQRALEIDPSCGPARKALQEMEAAGADAREGPAPLADDPDAASLPAAPWEDGEVLPAPPQNGRPRTAEELAMEEWEKEQEYKRLRKEFVLSGLKHGAGIGAGLLMLQAVLLGILAAVGAPLIGGDSGFIPFFLLVVKAGIIGGIFGAMVGLFVAWRDGGSVEGGIAGAVLLALLANLTGGVSPQVTFFLMFIGAVVGAMGGALIGYLTAMSIAE